MEFRFKQFKCRHGRSSMKIGIDAVLLGAWCDVAGDRILDVGTGCGVIALMVAQRNGHALVDAIDIDEDSVDEATENFENSPWASRLHAEKADFADFAPTVTYDLIVSNPPYFDSGISDFSTARVIARHEDSLSPTALLEKGSRLLSSQGRLAMVIPYGRKDEIIAKGNELGWRLSRSVDICGHKEAPVKRALLELVRVTTGISGVEISKLIIEDPKGHWSENYWVLCQDFYLKRH